MSEHRDNKTRFACRRVCTVCPRLLGFHFLHVNAMKCIYVGFSLAKLQTFFWKISLNSCLIRLEGFNNKTSTELTMCPTWTSGKAFAWSQAAQTHYMNEDVTLAYERCCVTNGYLQRLVWDRSVFLKRDKKCYVFKWNRRTLLPCCILCCLPASQAVLKRFRRVSAILVSHC